MPIIKLDAIDSTNDYLKRLAKESSIENYTIVLANEQTQGKGQMGALWLSEPHKNLTMSILFKDVQLLSRTLFDFNIAIALSIGSVLQQLNIPNIQVKWPNDIMADSKKVGGILIENIIKSDGSCMAIVGIGLNLNQTNFEGLSNATSLSLLTESEYEPEKMAELIVNSCINYLPLLHHHPELLWEYYEGILFKKDIPCAFEDSNGKRFMGIIKNVSRDGKLVLRLSDQSDALFSVKDIKMLY